MTSSLSTRAEQLWTYVRDHADFLGSPSFSVQTRTFREVDALVREVHLEIDWEMGPLGDQRFFALGPCGSRALLGVCREACAEGPAIPGWSKLAGRPPRAWTRRVMQMRIHGECVEVNFERWKFHVDGRYGPTAVLCFPSELDRRLNDSADVLCAQILHAQLGEVAVLELDLQAVFVEAGADDAPEEAVGPQGLVELIETLQETLDCGSEKRTRDAGDGV